MLTTDGAAPVRLSFPGEPITSIDDVPASIRTALTCRCQAGWGGGRKEAGLREFAERFH